MAEGNEEKEKILKLLKGWQEKETSRATKKPEKKRNPRDELG